MARDCLVGRIFGRLTVTALKETNAKTRRRIWLCTCSCGRTGIEKTTHALNRFKSCGCLQRDTQKAYIRKHFDLTGQVFRRLTVLSEGPLTTVGRRNTPRRSWNCLCSCGNTLSVTTESLKSGNTGSCGCYVTDKILEPRSSYSRRLESAHRVIEKRARQRGYAWELLPEETLKLFQEDCYYCGDAPSAYHHGLVRNGIDRIDNARGYIRDNCVPCCRTCNQMKHTLSFQDFVIQSKKIVIKHFPRLPILNPFKR